MKTIPFIGRHKELTALNLLLEKKFPSLVVVKGRRRIGKSRLIETFGQNQRFIEISGLPPTDKTTAQSQRNEFAIQLANQTDIPEVKLDDWSKLFALLATFTRQGRYVVLLDEISWMGSKDPDFLGKLKIAWDLYFKKNPEILLFLCGSASAWVEKNILSSTGFMGRISLVLSLDELPISTCSDLLKTIGCDYSPYDKFKLLSVTGGVPRYLEELQPSLTVDANINRLAYQRDGLLLREFDDIFHDLFGDQNQIYRKIVAGLANGALDHEAICELLGLGKSSYVSGLLDDLIASGFIKRDYTWRLNTGKESNLSAYRLSDNYLRFYLKYIEPNKKKIIQGQFEERSMASLQGWETIAGLQFENLVLNNRKFIYEQLKLPGEEILADNPFFQRQTLRHKGCQIDYLIQTKFNTLYVCEVKFSRNPVSTVVINQVKEKIERLAIPRGSSVRPVLIHVNGVSDAVIESEFFSKIIDFSELLSNP